MSDGVRRVLSRRIGCACNRNGQSRLKTDELVHPNEPFDSLSESERNRLKDDRQFNDVKGRSGRNVPGLRDPHDRSRHVHSAAGLSLSLSLIRTRRGPHRSC